MEKPNFLDNFALVNVKETKEKRQERKNMYISYVLAHAKGVEDQTMLIKEVILKWEESNK
jgi:hypothetical protein